MAGYPLTRMRRLRATETVRELVSENHVRSTDLIYPLFVYAGDGLKRPIATMPGVYQYSLKGLDGVLSELVDLDIKAVLLFGVPEHKDEQGTEAWSEAGIVQKAIARIKQRYPQLYVVGDVCLCSYTRDGHCGLTKEGKVLGDESLALLANISVAQAQAGVDMVAPSDMMDGRVQAIRTALDRAGHSEVALMSYAAKYASSFYGPFREAASSAPQFGDRRSYQMDPANGNEAVREILADVEEGADAILIKPALAYGDIIYRAKQVTGLPIAAYNVSGEYAMVKAASAQHFIDEQQVVLEVLLSLKRAGADMIISYHALDAARWLQQRQGTQG